LAAHQSTPDRSQLQQPVAMATRDVTTIAMSTDHVMSRGQHHLTIVDAAAAQPFSDGHERRLHAAASDKIYYIASLFVSSVMRQYLTLCRPPLPYGYSYLSYKASILCQTG